MGPWLVPPTLMFTNVPPMFTKQNKAFVPPKSEELTSFENNSLPSFNHFLNYVQKDPTCFQKLLFRFGNIVSCLDALP